MDEPTNSIHIYVDIKNRDEIIPTLRCLLSNVIGIKKAFPPTYLENIDMEISAYVELFDEDGEDAKEEYCLSVENINNVLKMDSQIDKFENEIDQIEIISKEKENTKSVILNGLSINMIICEGDNSEMFFDTNITACLLQGLPLEHSYDGLFSGTDIYYWLGDTSVGMDEFYANFDE